MDIKPSESTPKVSILLPTYNRGHLLGRAIDSVLNQTYTRYELIVIDDGSTDHTRQVVKGFKDVRIQYFKHYENKGISAARNTGLDAATGKYIAFIDSDDEWLPKKLEMQMASFENAGSHVGVVYTSTLLLDAQGWSRMPKAGAKKLQGDIHETLLTENIIPMPSVLMRKACFDQVGLFDENLYQAGDYELWLRISRKYKFMYIATPLMIKYSQPDGLSNAHNLDPLCFKYILLKHWHAFSKSKKKLGRNLFRLGNIFCQSGQMKMGRKCFFMAIKTYPLYLSSIAAICLSLTGGRLYPKGVALKQRLWRAIL